MPIHKARTRQTPGFNTWLDNYRLKRKSTTILIPPRFKLIINSLNEIAKTKGYEIYAVGGFVRDLLLGKSPKDLDIMVEGLDGGIGFAELVSKEMNIHPPVTFPKFGTAMLNIGEEQVEFVKPRKEYYKEDSRNPETELGSLEQDALRRDFGINSLFLRLSDNKIMDLTGKGLKDIKNKEINVSDESASDTIFSNDPLRMLRAIRFKQRLGFEIGKETREAIKRNAKRLSIISKERVNDELSKMMVKDVPSKVFEDLKDLNLLPEILPELMNLVEVAQPVKYHSKDVWNHTMQVLDKSKPALIDRLAALLHDVGKPATKKVDSGVISFHGHEEVGGEIAKKILRKYRYPEELVQKVSFIIKNHMRPHGFSASWTDSAVRRFARDMGDSLDSVLSLAEADATSSRPERVEAARQSVQQLRDRIRDVQKDKPLSEIKELLSGHDLASLFGKTPGPWIREAKNLVAEKQLENPELTKEDATTLVKENESIIFNKSETLVKKSLLGTSQYSLWVQKAVEHKNEENDPVKGIIELNGIILAIEWPRGSDRRWKPSDDPIKMQDCYGYVSGTEDPNDKMDLDVYVGSNHSSKNVYVIRQLKANGSFDEPKFMLGFNSSSEAKESYLYHTEKLSCKFGSMKRISWEDFEHEIATNLERPKIQKAKKGTPQYQIWLEKFQAHVKPKVEEPSTPRPVAKPEEPKKPRPITPYADKPKVSKEPVVEQKGTGPVITPEFRQARINKWQEVVDKARAGDEEATNALLKEVDGSIKKFAIKYSTQKGQTAMGKYEMEDAISDAKMAALEALQYFDPSKGSWSTVASDAIRTKLYYNSMSSEDFLSDTVSFQGPKIRKYRAVAARLIALGVPPEPINISKTIALTKALKETVKDPTERERMITPEAIEAALPDVGKTADTEQQIINVLGKGATKKNIAEMVQNEDDDEPIPGEILIDNTDVQNIPEQVELRRTVRQAISSLDKSERGMIMFLLGDDTNKWQIRTIEDFAVKMKLPLKSAKQMLSVCENKFRKFGTARFINEAKGMEKANKSIPDKRYRIKDLYQRFIEKLFEAIRLQG